MSLLTESSLRSKANAAYRHFQKSNASEILMEHKKAYTALKRYDIFLSHAYLDAELILGIKTYFEDQGYTIYVDWIDDPMLDRTKVDKSTALLLKERMSSCRSLLYAFTQNSINSKWMPWELGFFDGFDGKVCVIPIAKGQTTESYNIGVEYLDVYPYFEVINDTGYVSDSFLTFVSFEKWLKGEKPEFALKYLIK